MGKINKLIPDTSVIIEGLISKKLTDKELEVGSVVIHEAVILLENKILAKLVTFDYNYCILFYKFIRNCEMGKVYSIICKRRTIRRFQDKVIPENILTKLINAARLAPSSSNIQPSEFIVIDDTQVVDAIFPYLKWAAYIEPAGDPPKGERPVAYIVAVINVRLKKKGGEADVAAAIENILLTACEENIGSCWIHSVDRKEIKKLLRIPHHLDVNSVIALGYPNEQPVVEIAQKSVIKYWKDEDGVIHVPKRILKEIMHRNTYNYNDMEDI